MEGFTSLPARSSESPQEQPCDLTSEELQRIQQQRKILFPSPSGEDSPKEQESSTSSYIQQLLKTSCPSSSSSTTSSSSPSLSLSTSTVEASNKSILYNVRSSLLSKTSPSTVQPSLYGWMLNSGTWKGHYTHRRRRWGYHLGQDFRALQSSRYNALYRRSALGSCSSLYRPSFSSQAPLPPLLPLQSSDGLPTADLLGKVPPPLLPLSEEALQDAVAHQYPSMSKRLATHHIPYAGMVMASPRMCETSSPHHHHHHPLSDGASATGEGGGGGGGGGTYLDSPQSTHYSHHATCQSPQSLQSQLHLTKWQYQPYPTARADHRCCDRLCPLRHCQQTPSSHLYSLHGSGGTRGTVACTYASSPFDVSRQSMVNIELQSQSATHLPFPSGPGAVPPPPPPPLPPQTLHDELAKGLPASHLHCRH